MSVIVKGQTIYGPNVITNGLVFYVDSANIRSYPTTGTTWSDMSGYRNDGTLTNGPTFNTSDLGVIAFDGVNDYAPITSVGFPFGASSGTISSWAKTNVVDNNYHWTLSYGTALASQSRFVGIYTNVFYFGGFGNDITAYGAQINTWYNLVGVYNGSQALLYINGVLVSGPTAKSWNTVSNNSQIGRQTNGGDYWNGSIANVQVYNRALSASEVLQNYNALKFRFKIPTYQIPLITNGLVLYLDAADTYSYSGSGTNWNDLSGYLNFGTLTNGPTFNSNNGGNIVFNGTNNYAPIFSNKFPFGSSPGTLSAWVKITAIDSNFRWIIAYGTNAISQARFIGVNGTTFYFGGFGNDITATGAQANVWFNMVGIYSGSAASLYINGVLVSGPTAKSWNTAVSTAMIGNQINAGATEYWNGSIANVQVYDRALSASEVLQNFNILKSRFGL